MTKTLISTTLTSKAEKAGAHRYRPFFSPNSPNSGSRHGFTLVEILVVVALMALVFAAALPGIGSAIRASIENSSRELATTIRAAYDESILKGRVCRVVLDLDKNQYWVEQGPANLLLMTSEQKEEMARKDARLTKEELEAKPKPTFGMAIAVTKNKINLPSGVVFTDVTSSLSKEPVKGGLVYAHIYPHGFIEKLTIHLKDLSQHEATLFVNPVSGRSKLFNSYVKETQK